MGDAIETGRRRNGEKTGRRKSSRWPKATLFTFSFTYTTVTVHRNFVLLPVPMASPVNNTAYLDVDILYPECGQK